MEHRPRVLPLLVLLAGCRPGAETATDTPADTGAPAAKAQASIAPTPTSRAIALAARTEVPVVLLDDGRLLAWDRRAPRALPASQGRTALRGDGPWVAYLEKRKPFVWNITKDDGPRTICDLAEARDMAIADGRICLVTLQGTLACTDVEDQDCAALHEQGAKAPQVRHLASGAGGPLAFDPLGTASFVRFGKSGPRLEPIKGSPVGVDFLGTLSRFSLTPSGSYIGKTTDVCLQSRDGWRCWDLAKGTVRPVPSLPADASKARLVGRDAICYLQAGKVGCVAVDAGVHDETRIYSGRRLAASLPELPREAGNAVDFDAQQGLSSAAMTVITDQGAAWRWEGELAKADGGWQRLAFDAR